MRANPIPLITICLFVGFTLQAQDSSSLLLRSGVVIPENNIGAEKINAFNNNALKTAGKSFAIIQFDKLPGPEQKKQLLQQGIELLEYIPNKAYTVSISGLLQSDFLKQMNARAIVELSAFQKMQPELFAGNFPSWAVKSAGTVDTWISFPKSFSFETVKQELQSRGFSVMSTDYKNYRILAVRASVQRLGELALLPFIEYVQAAPAPDNLLNSNSMSASTANVLKAPIAFGGKGLDGQNVVVGFGEDGDVQTHLDFTGRLINRAGFIPKAHGTHVAGTIGGAGIIKELYAGYAPKATLLGQLFSNVLVYAPAYVQDYGMVITNNSYGSVVNDCNYNGLYDLTARMLDQMAIDLPELNNVFAAGNDGTKTCSPYALGFKTVLGGYQCAKNIVTAGSVDYKNNLSAFSGRGPVRDGRTKPEITAMGEFVASTWTNNNYSYSNGTSMAAPAVSGGMALLIQRYRQLHSSNPSNSLTKALLCNGASDGGNAGPDFKYGFGTMNLLRSLKMMEDNTYFASTVAQNNTITETINVPANTAQLKVLLYWADPPAAVMAAKTLVNDLDLSVTGPGGTVLPLKLDTLTANVNNNATSAEDHINNIEQVIINNPATGNYDLNVFGNLIAQNPSQDYVLVYDIIPESLVLTNPVGGEHMVPTVTPYDTVYIHWNSYGGPATTFTLEFSYDNGGSWTTLNNNIPATSRVFSWPVPNFPTDVARIRLTKNSTALTQTSFPFTITDMPIDSLTPTQCEGYIQLGWRAVPGATDYEVMMLQGDEMTPVATTTSLNYTFSGLSKDTLYWVTVRPRINGNPGRRAFAVSRKPNSGTCSGSISDNDLKIDSIISPASSGRVFTSTELSNSVPLTIRIKNLDNAVSSGNIIASYSINGGPTITETITSPLAGIVAGGFIDYTFATNANLSALGAYSIEFTATKASDPVIVNNSQTKIFKQLDNQPITAIDLPWTDNLESIPEQTVVTKQMGLSGNDRYDFSNFNLYGRLRTFLNSGNAFSGSKAITLDMSRYQLHGNTDTLIATFNLNSFIAGTDELRFDFRFKNHYQQDSLNTNKVWIRGSDLDNWIEMYDLFTNQNNADGSYKLSASLEIADSLAAHGQVFSSSFQVRWVQWGEFMAADDVSGAGYSFDDFRIYKAIDDIQLLSIDTPMAITCNLSSAVPVKISVRNTTATIQNNIPVVLRVDGSIVATETIPFIPANDTVQYTFNPATADLSGAGSHTLDVWVNLATDNFPDNDTSHITIKSLPLINSFPYLEDFENGAGNWYATPSGNSTWEYGSPVSAKINQAASGAKAWKTNMAGYYNDSELSYLYSPCFDLSGMTSPTISFNLSLDIEDCGNSLCDAAWMEYSTDGGSTWSKLGTYGTGTNWYNKDYPGNPVWSQQDFIRWHVATTALPTTNNNSIRFRFVFDSDEGLSKDGIAVDDIHIYDNIHGIYDVTGASPIVNQPSVNGTGWIDFIESGTNKLIASVNPNGQNLGNTDVQSFINNGPVRNDGKQFYHDRNITIKPATTALADSATVRFYFLDNETEALINATGCTLCTKPSMAKELGVTKYSDADDNKENGTLADNTPGNYLFINAGKVKKVPFDKGYYAEFKVKDFSEFWLNNGGPDKSTALPVQLQLFTASKTNLKDVLAEWVTSSEVNVLKYEVQVAKGNIVLQQGGFTTIGEVMSRGNSSTEQHYNYIDAESNKTGVRYYRLKIVDIDGRSSYSPIRPVIFNDEISWQVSPNPSTGKFTLICQGENGEKITIKMYDLDGKLIKRQQVLANGFVQKINMELGDSHQIKGLYLMEVTIGLKKQSFKLLKQ